ncbi:hypothetical protein B5M42_003930 [Paenibacillus athensensis]|uniref:Uncharacterized protein n=2 Tax=Paenibacillus athensensis TaxID=1967502 RepID=A0A4Y8PTF9_9BACL|nr:hypothetical protein [Paenibacillus athensensis]
MIKTTDLKLQMDELTKQNDMMLIELEQLKKMLLGSGQSEQSGADQMSSDSGANGSSGSGSGGSPSQAGKGGQQQASDSGGQKQQGQQQQSQGQGQNQSQNAGSGSDNGQNGQVADLANELLKIKAMVEKLEQKTSQYVSSQSDGTMTDKDAVNLVLTLMNGMVDWASEFVLAKGAGSGQLQ